MAKKVYAVMGASGQIGRVITEQLLKKGHQVKALGRDQKKLEPLKSKGAEVVVLQGFDKEAVLTKAFNDVDGVFTMVPPGYGVDNFAAYQANVGEAVKAAVQKNDIQHVVNLSSIGAHLPEGTGPIKGLYGQEQRLNALPGPNILHLRPGFFMENFLGSIPVILQTGALKTPLKPELSLPAIATEDIGMRAAEFLDRCDFKGHTVFELIGPRAHNLVETAKILGSAIGKPELKYVQLTYDEAKKAMLAAGAKPALADLFIEMYKAFNDGKCLPTQKLTADHQGKTTLEQFAAKNFAKAFKAQAEKQKVMV
jgi:uncharacterized protein YbjT (DUF2867 family)